MQSLGQLQNNAHLTSNQHAEVSSGLELLGLTCINFMLNPPTERVTNHDFARQCF